jgi:hypothetical protein
MYTTGKYNTMYHTTNIQVDEDLMQEELYALQKCKWHNFTVSTILLRVFYTAVNFQLGYNTTDFKQMKSYEKCQEAKKLKYFGHINN